MILADTSVWINHFKKKDKHLHDLLFENKIVTHDLILIELASGSLKNRQQTLSFLNNLFCIPSCSDDEVRALIEAKQIYSLGIGAVDVHLIASCLVYQAELLTYDKALNLAWQKCRK